MIEHGPVEFSNAVRLTLREWIVVGLFTLLLGIFAPRLWKDWEPFAPASDYRMPHDLSNDYWFYQRWAEQAVFLHPQYDAVIRRSGQYDTLVMGDSVAWGEYTTPRETLSHYLNEFGGRVRCANLGLDGAHPLALGGLIEHYSGRFTGKNVILICNPLWLSSPGRDLQDEKATEFNHPRLLPQFVPPIPAYPVTRADLTEHLGIAVEQRSPFHSWPGHLQQAYYGGVDIPGWTLEHPDENPAGPLGRGLPAVDQSLRHPARPWYESGITKQDFPWIELDSSLQWHAFQHAVKTLQDRGNRVFVLVGPFNEHLLTPASHERYERLKAGIVARLQERQIPHLAPPPLPSDEYGDASHPLAAGYARLARLLLNEAFFK